MFSHFPKFITLQFPLFKNQVGLDQENEMHHHHHHQHMSDWPGDVGEVPVTYVKQWKVCRMSCDVGEAAEGLENELCRR